ncbi:MULTISPECIES: YydF family exported signaling peptide [unclassified Curtobacterium]|nr:MULTISPECIES: YydF family exported signaling peptide [unclassified Curtobacterium]PYY31569.1 YydF family exported signaling peptide [Curtobacterium sp. MCBD17_030]PZE36495.1 YydF family exported signaling peptide [Curtobacterium sp. MCPF17_031]PZE61218.1 YydF family exported signaling peptide [Curtobacterium sp. MCPF17_001]PZF09153.1 YydF family exported signaling peptide [Curtobacterium sp. MCPF17_011]PZF66702.1 YydF family exported signaling peptide [Curtobacterium sp. MCPF17_047]
MQNNESANMLQSFTLDDRVAELDVVDDLWYFVVGSGGAVIVGSGKG